MLSVLKFTMTGVGLVLIVIAIGAILFSTQVGKIGTRAVSSQLKEAFASEIEIGSVAVSPFRRAIEVRDFALLNPPDFKEGPAFTCKKLTVEFDLSTIFSDAPVIEELVIDGAEIHYRHEIGEGTNIGTLARLAEEKSAEDSSTAFVIKHLVCKNAKVSFSTNLIPKVHMGLDMVTVDLTDIHGAMAITNHETASIFLRSLIKETLTLKGLLKPLMRPLRKDAEAAEEAG